VPLNQPPPSPPGTPSRHLLPAGTQLWRVHQHYLKADGFGPPTSSVFGGGRFDATVPGRPGQLYASARRPTAIAEHFLPGLHFDEDGHRFLPRKALERHTLSAVTTIDDLTLLRLTTAEDLAAIGQDHWLLSASADQYAVTREWTAWIRRTMPWAQGILWQSTIDLSRTTIVLFEPEDGEPVVQAVDDLSYQLAGMAKEDWWTETLSRYGVSTEPVEQPRPSVFVNYRSSDAGDAARMMTNELARRIGERFVFRDVQSIPAGTPYAGELLDKARGCSVLLVLIGPGWELYRDSTGRAIDNPEDWVRREIVAATSAGAWLVPVLIGMRRRLRPESLPDPLSHLADAQYYHLPDGFTDVHTGHVVTQLLERFPELRP
jgi:hypothetical protein